MTSLISSSLWYLQLRRRRRMQWSHPYDSSLSSLSHVCNDTIFYKQKTKEKIHTILNLIMTLTIVVRMAFTNVEWSTYVSAMEEYDKGDIRLQQKYPPQLRDKDQLCERLKTSLTFSQEDAPSEVSGLFPIVVEHINRELEGVVDVEVEWKGSDLQPHTAHHVGEHIIQCKVRRLAAKSAAASMVHVATSLSSSQLIDNDDSGDAVITQCYHIPFTITDTNECLLPSTHPMAHSCHLDSTICINTIGSYECVCRRLSGDSVENSSYKHGDTISSEDELLYFQQQLLINENRSPWEVSFKSASQTSCPNQPSTFGCCTANSNGSSTTIFSATGILSPNDNDNHATSSCKALFRCPIDPCSRPDLNDCSEKATCIRKASPSRRVTSTPGMSSTIGNRGDKTNANNNNNIKDYTCRCPNGLMGNGHQCNPGIDPHPQPKVKHDGTTPTDETIRNNFYCDCTVPQIDHCAGFPPCTGKHEECTVDPSSGQPICACKKGYMFHDTYGCVDEEPPELQLKNDPNNDQTLRLRQGDMYTEYAVNIQDENAEDYLRSLKISYSQPLPKNKCFVHVGEFHVNYTIATPWTVPPYVRITRRVVIEDVDECSIDVNLYKTVCPELIPKCDPIATCINTVGSYRCQCPQYTTGDGFLRGLVFTPSDSYPVGYKGGQGCIDTTPPTLKIRGPNPKVFRVASCSTGIFPTSNVSSSKITFDKQDLKRSQQQYYNTDVKMLVAETGGAELCATHVQPNPKPTDCIYAQDMTANGPIDLTNAVVVGEPVKKGPLRWSVPYNVKDAAGNAASTVWRDIVIDEVNLLDMEQKIRHEILTQQAAIMDQAIARAVENERNRVTEELSKTTHGRRAALPCPECPKCRETCSVTANDRVCDSYCKAKVESCAIDEASLVLRMLLYAEKYFFNPTLVLTILSCGMVIVFVIILRSILTALFNPSYYQQLHQNTPMAKTYYNVTTGLYDDDGERRLQESVVYYKADSNSETTAINGGDRFYVSTPNGSRIYDNGLFDKTVTSGNETTRNASHSASRGPPRASMTMGSINQGSFFTPVGGSSPIPNSVGSSNRDILSQQRSRTTTQQPSLFMSPNGDEYVNQTSSSTSSKRYAARPTPTIKTVYEDDNDDNDIDDIYISPRNLIITPSRRGGRM